MASATTNPAAATKPTLLTDLTFSMSHVPSNFVRPLGDRPNLQDFQSTDGSSIPLIDLQDLDGPNRSLTIRQIGDACWKYGFFQEMVQKMVKVSREFFRLSESERMKSYSDDPTKTTRLSTSFNVKTEKDAKWRDFLRLHCHPLEDYIHEWPTNPPCFREDEGEYCKKMRELSLRLLEAISQSLGLEKDYINKALGQHGQHMAINYYPPCPEPELTYGLPGHADPNVITLLLQDDVPGLQVLNDGKWLAVNPVPNTFTVNIGDQIQRLVSPPPPIQNPNLRQNQNDQPSPSPDEPNRQGLCNSITIVVLLACFLIPVPWLVFRLTKLQFRVVSAAVYALNDTAPPLMTTSMQFTIVITNPNRRVRIYLDTLNAYVSYWSHPITTPVPVSRDVSNGLAMDEAYDVVDLSVIMQGRLRWNTGEIRTGHYGIFVKCEVLMSFKKEVSGQVPLTRAPACYVDG